MRDAQYISRLHTVLEVLKQRSGQLYSFMLVYQALNLLILPGKHCPEHACGRTRFNPDHQPHVYLVIEDTDVKIVFYLPHSF